MNYLKRRIAKKKFVCLIEPRIKNLQLKAFKYVHIVFHLKCMKEF